jgi:hypothetical protein
VSEVDDERFSRQVALFGREGQLKIAANRAAIVGLGGLGSHLAQQLALLGVIDFVLIDHDRVTASSRNRVIGARPDDVDKTTKVEVAKRVILDIEPTAVVDCRSVKLEAARDALADRTVVFAGIDSDLVRLQLTEIAAENHLPYFDLASDTDVDDNGAPTFGGRVVFADGTRCPYCLGLLDQDEIRRDGLPLEARKAHDEIYGIDRDALGESGPAVVSVNGVVASIAVTEFMVWATEMREPEPQLVYYGERRIIRRVLDHGDPSCPYCSSWRR